MSLSFKQFSTFLAAPLEDAGNNQLGEMWPFKNAVEKEKASLEKLKLLAKKGDLKAKLILKDLERLADRKQADARAKGEVKNRAWADAQARSEAGDRGSSRAFDRETGSLRASPKSGTRGTTGTRGTYIWDNDNIQTGGKPRG
jgi:hypothetical protein